MTWVRGGKFYLSRVTILDDGFLPAPVPEKELEIDGFPELTPASIQQLEEHHAQLPVPELAPLSPIQQRPPRRESPQPPPPTALALAHRPAPIQQAQIPPPERESPNPTSESFLDFADRRVGYETRAVQEKRQFPHYRKTGKIIGGPPMFKLKRNLKRENKHEACQGS